MVNTLIALGIMLSGFALFALIYNLKNKSWNGFKNKEKLVVSAAILALLSVLLVNVPDVAASLKVLTGLDVNVESSKVGFITMGFAIAALLASNYKVAVKKGKKEAE